MPALWEEGVASPCTKICVLDEGDICTGCYRSRAEIACWSQASDAEKRGILSLIEQRRQRTES